MQRVGLTAVASACSHWRRSPVRGTWVPSERCGPTLSGSGNERRFARPARAVRRLDGTGDPPPPSDPASESCRMAHRLSLSCVPYLHGRHVKGGCFRRAAVSMAVEIRPESINHVEKGRR